MPGTLYIVGTPIGNLTDITLRALSTLREVDLIAAEDTRITRKLLSHYGITTPMTPYHQHSLGRKAEKLIEELNSGMNIAVVSDAGMPGISDPGHDLIKLAISEGIDIVVVPGPSAMMTALVASGLSTFRFAFDGFPPRRSSEKRALFIQLKDEPRTMVFYESPHRILALLKDMKAVWGDRQIAVMREATKLFEEVLRGPISSILEHFAETQPRGEFTVVVSGCETEEKPAEPAGDEIEAALMDLIRKGSSERDAVREVTERFALPKKEVYRRMLALKANGTIE